MINPFFIYILGFLITFIVYTFGWSHLFPRLTVGIFLFIGFTFIISIVLGSIFHQRKMVTYYKTNLDDKHKSSYLLIIVAVGYIIEFVHFGGIPLLSLFLAGDSGIYKDFGIPVFHVLLVTFNCFYAIYSFHVFLSSTERKRVLLQFICLLLPSILIVNRGMLMMILVSCAFLYLCKVKRLKMKNLTILIVVGLVFLYGFGIFGNIRVNDSYNRQQNPFDSSVILKVGGATEEFQASYVPRPFFWSYIYIASPLANFQKNVNSSDVEYSPIFFARYLNNEWLPDFISKRINTIVGWSNPLIEKISPTLTVGTTYATSYVLFGWIGCILSFLWMSAVTFVYLTLLKKTKSKYFLTSLVIFNTIFLFSTFSNMFTFSGWSFQLIYPVIFEVLNWYKNKYSYTK